ncbi:MAG: DUF7619 domain-containing protein [Aureispira sp.]
MIKLLLIVLFFIGGASFLQAQTTAIPDAAFEQKLIALGIDSDGIVNGQLLNSDALGVTKLLLRSSSIASLEGIAAFVNLDTLNVEVNQLDSLDLTGNMALKQVFCARNNLVAIDLSASPLLEDLNCRRNSLSTLDLSGNTALEILNCSENNLTTLDITTNTALTNLDCSINHLTNLDVRLNVNLDLLNCSSNDLATLDASTNLALEELFCRWNDLTVLDVMANGALKKLDCDSNHLTVLDVSSNLLLESLVCGNNNLTVLDVSSNTPLKSLSCYNNSLTSLDISSNLLLEELNCGWNDLPNLDVHVNTNLEKLSCSNINLTSLDVSSNVLLQNLRCTDNQLDSLDLSANVRLGVLDCGWNELVHLDVHTARYLSYLDCWGNNLTVLDLRANLYMGVLSCAGNDLSYLLLPDAFLLSSVECRWNSPDLVICIDAPSFPIFINSWQKDPSAIYTKGCFPLSATGTVAFDDNLNCLVDSLEQGIPGQLISFVDVLDTTNVYVASTDSLGNYRAYLDTGSYNLHFTNNYYWQACVPNQRITIDTNYTLQVVDWSIEPIVSCPLLEVDISAPFLRRAGGGSAYTVSYCNQGTIAEQGVYIEVDIDTNLIIAATSIPIVNQVGSVYTFSLGTLGVGECGSFNIQVLVNASAQVGQTHCTEVHIYPDTICAIQWQGPVVGGSVSCQNNTVDFFILNKGTLMLSPQSYTIFEDNIAMRTGTITLGAGQSNTIAQAAGPGHTYRIEIDQAVGFPPQLGDAVFSRAIEGCYPFPDGSFNTGFITQFSNGHSAPFMAIDCQQSIASYDPNDKAAQPVGYNSNFHYIEKNTALDYKIRFQNTGTDTAFNILILDTISPFLDLTTLQMGASSHAYTWSVNGNVLKVRFSDIMLVDSNANEPLSHGFFRYRIEQVANNPLGSIINNEAAIYFDYNLPIFTNTTFHTVGENFMVQFIGTDVLEESIALKIYPNPFTHSTTLEINGPTHEVLEVVLYDVTGRIVDRVVGQGNQVQINRKQLIKGLYFYELKGDGQRLATGKVVVK